MLWSDGMCFSEQTNEETGANSTQQLLWLLALLPVGIYMLVFCRRSAARSRARKAAALREEKLRGNGLACIRLVNRTGVALQVPFAF
jgi:hypothetical protein